MGLFLWLVATSYMHAWGWLPDIDEDSHSAAVWKGWFMVFCTASGFVGGCHSAGLYNYFQVGSVTQCMTEHAALGNDADGPVQESSSPVFCCTASAFQLPCTHFRSTNVPTLAAHMLGQSSKGLLSSHLAGTQFALMCPGAVPEENSTDDSCAISWVWRPIPFLSVGSGHLRILGMACRAFI